MSGEVRNLYVVLSANATAFRGQMVAAGATVRGFGADVTRATHESAALRKGLSTAGLVAGGLLVAGLTAGVMANIRLEQQMKNVATISDEVANNFAQYTQDLIDMSTRLPQTAGQLADSLYDIVSAGFDGADAMKVLEASATAAAAGLTDTKTAGEGILTVLNAYGLSADHAGEVSDILFQTVNVGVLTFEQLAGALGKVVPTAAAAGIEFDEVASAMAAMTLSGLSADEASTALNQTMSKILNPTQEMTRAISALGYETGTSLISALGFKGAIDAISESQGSAADTAFRLFSDIRAARGYLTLTANAGDNYARTFGSIADQIERAESTQRAFQTQQEALAASGTRFSATVSAIGLNMSSVLLPVLSLILSSLEAFSSMVSAIPGPIQQLIGVLALLAGSVMLVGGAFLRGQRNIAAFRAELATLTGASRTAAVAMRGLQLAIPVVGIALAGATALYSAYTSQKQKAKQRTDELVEALRAEAQGVSGASASTLAHQMVEDGTLDTLKSQGVDLAQAFRGIAGTQEDWSALLDTLNPKLAITSAELDRARLRVDELSEQVFLNPGNVELADELTRAINDSNQAQLNVEGQNIRTEKTYDSLRRKLEEYRKELNEARGITEGQAEAEQELNDAMLASGDAITRVQAKLAPLVDGKRELSAEAAKLGESLEGFIDPMGAFRDSLEDGEASLARFTEQLRKQVRDQQNWVNNMAELAGRGRMDLVSMFADLGPEAAGLLAEAVDATDKELDRLSKVVDAKGNTTVEILQRGFELMPHLAADAGARTIEEFAAAYADKPLSEVLAADVEEAVVVLAELSNTLGDVPEQKQIELLLEQVNDPLAAAKALRDVYNDLPEEVRTDIATHGIPETERDIARLQRAYGLTPDEIETILRARDNASVEIDKVNAKVARIPREVTVTVRFRSLNQQAIAPSQFQSGVQQTPQENGGLWMGGVQTFAAGGFSGHGFGSTFHQRVPQLVRGGTNILWAEESTGWEAYISGKPSMRERNRAIWAEAGRRLGFDMEQGRREHVTAVNNQTTVIAAPMPDRMVLEVDGQQFTAYVRAHAGQVAGRVARAEVDAAAGWDDAQGGAR
jgi:TP901 family phage tail tape measure protein